VSLTSHQVKEIWAESVCFKKLNFQVSSQTRKHLKFAKVERVDKSVKCLVSTAREERVERLKNCLASKPFITRAEYMRIRGVLKDRALSDLKSFIEEGWLPKCAGRTVAYLLNKGQ